MRCDECKWRCKTSCRRYPPQYGGAGLRWPEVAAHQFCGEFSHRGELPESEEFNAARQALLSEGVRVGELEEQIATLAIQLVQARDKHAGAVEHNRKLVTERDAARLFADDEITERAAAEKKLRKILSTACEDRNDAIAARVAAEKERNNLKGLVRDLKDQLGSAIDARDGAEKNLADAKTIDGSLRAQCKSLEQAHRIETTRRQETEKERDNLKDQLGMDPSERFTLQDKWHNEKERRQAAEKRIAGMRAFRVQADELLTKLTSLLEVALTP